MKDGDGDKAPAMSMVDKLDERIQNSKVREAFWRPAEPRRRVMAPRVLGWRWRGRQTHMSGM